MGMARTTHSTTNQNSLGPVGLAAEPDDIVPLKQAGSSDIIWGHAHGRAAEVTVSRKLGFYWDAGVYDGEPPLAMPFEMRLKGVGWYPYGKNWDLNVIRNTTVVATVGANSYTDLDILFQPVLNGWFQTSSFVRLAFNWNLLTYWEIVSKSGSRVEQVPAEVLSSMAPGMQDIESERIQEPLYQSPEQLAAPVESQKTNRLAAWIRRRWK